MALALHNRKQRLGPLLSGRKTGRGAGGGEDRQKRVNRSRHRKRSYMSERRTRPRASARGRDGGPNPAPVAIGRKQQALELARQGLPPSEIADRIGVPFASVMAHLYGLVGEGTLRRSDIVFS